MGAGLFSLLILLLAAASLAYTGVFVACGLAVIALAFLVREERVRLPDFPYSWKLLFASIFLFYWAFYFVNAMAPEASPDGSTYHLGLVAKYLRQHGLGHITTSIYADLSEGLEMLFLPAFSIGRHSAAALVEFGFFVTLPLAMLSYARRFGFPQAGVTAAVIILCSSVFGISGTSAYNDAAAALVVFCLFYALQIWVETRQPAMLIVAGLLAGFGYGIKYSLFLAAPYTLGFVAWHAVRARQPFFRPLLITGLCALALAAPWLVKNYWIVGNPLAPFANKYFPNPYVTEHFETDYVKVQRPDGPLLNRFIDDTIRGGPGGGYLGPLFLLTPLGLLALRYRQGRQALLAAAVFVIPAFANGQTRFLMPAAPFIAIAISLGFWKATGALPILTIAAALLALPRAADVYCDNWTWRVHQFILDDALRIRSEQESLEKRLPGYKTLEMINRKVPPTGRVYALATPQDAYAIPDTIVGYESAEGETLKDFLETAVDPNFFPNWVLTFRFPAEALRAVRVVQTAAGTDADEWNIAEVKISLAGRALSRNAPWKLSANANPWDAGYAFDGEALTRWRSRVAMFSGMWIQAEFGAPQTIDTVELVCAHDQWAIRLKLQGQDTHGAWRDLALSPAATDRAVTEDLRREAIENFKKHGITHILLNKGDYAQPDFLAHPEAWGVELVGRQEDDWLFAIQ